MLRLSKGKQAKGIIKASAEDFKVEEIIQTGKVLEIGKSYNPVDLGFEELSEGKFSIFVLQKKDWNTAQALKAIARKFRRGIKSTAFAGTKDRTSVSTQLCSIFGIKPEELGRIHIKDMSINGAWFGNEKVRMGDLLGNRFGITIKDPVDYDNIQPIIDGLNGVFPNYFGEQRFGSRKTNVEIGVDILKGNFKEAAMNFLTKADNEINEDSKEARERLANELDFKEAMRYFPEYLKYERMMIEYLSKFPDNYANSIRKLPRSLSLMFIHSVEDYIFNKELEERIANEETEPKLDEFVCYEDTHGFPDIANIGKFNPDNKNRVFLLGNIIGHDTESITDIEKRILDELGLNLESFKVKGMNELNSKGTYRALFAPFKDISNIYQEELGAYELGFSLPAGSYATIFLSEFIQEKV